MSRPHLVYIETLLDGQLTVPALINNGAAINLISLQMVKMLGKQEEVIELPRAVDLVSYSGEKASPLGEIKLSIKIGSQKFKKIPFLVAELHAPDTITIGQQFCNSFTCTKNISNNNIFSDIFKPTNTILIVLG